MSRTASFIYFSVDVLAPGALARLADLIIEEGVDIRWAAEIRLERAFTAETCRKLRKSGCVAVSFGFESASQRILDLIDKGTDVAVIPSLMRAFTDAGIAVQMMGFTGFPGETLAEAEQTFAFLEATADCWTIAGVGGFALTPGSIVARDPTRFGVSLSAEPPPDNIFFRQYAIPGTDPTANSRLDALRSSVTTAEFDRPFAGGIDAAHTLFYHEAFGLAFPRHVIAAAASVLPDEILEADGEMVENVAFSVNCCAEAGDLISVRRAANPAQTKTVEQFLAHLETMPRIRRLGTPASAFAATSGALLDADEGLTSLLYFVASHRIVGTPALAAVHGLEERFLKGALDAGILRSNCSDPRASPGPLHAVLARR